MKKYFVILFASVFLLSSCKKENITDENQDEYRKFALENHLTLKTLDNTIKPTRSFASLTDLKKFLSAHDTVSYKVSIQLRDSISKMKNLSQDYTGDVWLDDWGLPYKQYHVNFVQLEADGYASLAVFGIGIGPDGSEGLLDFTLLQNGASYGSYSYTNQFIQHGGQTIGFEGMAQGIYQEIYGVGGVASYYVNYHTTFNCSYLRTNSPFIFCKIKLERIN